MEEEKKPEEQPVEPEQPEQAPPSPEPTPPPEPVQPMPAEAQPVQPPTSEPAPPPPPSAGDTNTLIILGWVFVGLGVLFCCCCGPLFAAIGAILGGIAYSRGDQRGLPVLIVGIVVFLLGGGSLAFYRIYHWPPPWERFPGMHGHWRSA